MPCSSLSLCKAHNSFSTIGFLVLIFVIITLSFSNIYHMFQTECIFAFIRLYVLALMCCNEMHGNAISSLNLNDGQADGFHFFLHLISIPFSK